MQIEQKRKQTDMKVAMTFEEKRKSQMIKKGMEDTIREDRQKTVERIMRQQEYHRNQILKKIEQDDKKSMSLKNEKA